MVAAIAQPPNALARDFGRGTIGGRDDASAGTSIGKPAIGTPALGRLGLAVRRLADWRLADWRLPDWGLADWQPFDSGRWHRPSAAGQSGSL
jgi:hypothetical protein